ncbi:MAG: bifunctional [glutamate--ammonia ligase]-adenylyl-L-tyrosine phosphorylase/[glutamate--ammonia-ligase] adenylyltransferase [Thermodesulfobacteriota bacterium]
MAAFTQKFAEKAGHFQLSERQAAEAEKVFLFSEFVYRTVMNTPEFLADLFQSGDLNRSYHDRDFFSRVQQVTAPARDDEEIGSALRRIRQREMIRIAWRDLCRKADLFETLKDLSSFADACIQSTVLRLHSFLEKEFGTPVSSGGAEYQLITLGMGKLGAQELNFSSDIDLVFVYPDDGETGLSPGSNVATPPRHAITNEDFFTRLARRLTKVLGQATDEGIVFRVDLRLRPYGDSGPVVMSIDAMEDYLVAQGREWERYAYIKARAITGNTKDIIRLKEILHAFVFRKHLDYASFDSLRDMKQSIVTEIKRKGLKNNIKIGTGGIREIEFFGQIFQLIRGGVEPALRERKIFEVLELLVEGGHIPQTVSRELKDAYTFLRYTEHRLQEYADAQTHTLPRDNAGKARLAASMGFNDWRDFLPVLDSHMAKVHHHFTQILGVSEPPLPSDQLDLLLLNAWKNFEYKEQAVKDLGQAGFDMPEHIYRMIDHLRTHSHTRTLSREGRERVNKLIPVILKKTLLQENAERLLNKLIDLVLTIEKRTCYIALLNENPSVIDHLIKLTKESPWIISYLTQHPVLLDELLDNRIISVPPEKDKMSKELKARLQKISIADLEDMIVETCIFKQVNTFRVAASDVSGAFPLMKVSDYLTDIAEVILEIVYRIIWNELTKKHGFPSQAHHRRDSDTDFVVIGFGKLGGIELGYGSDLDLVFIHAGDSGRTTGRDQPVDNAHFYYRLGQKIIHFLTTRTTAGRLYEVDMRLRPNGDAGMIVSHISSFGEYYENNAWTWEHQALVRARPICGDQALFDRFKSIRKAVLCKKRNRSALLEEVNSMREKMRAEHGNRDSNLFDLKQDKGGIIDIEFLVQYLVLANAHEHPELSRWTDNIRLLETMAEHGILDVESAGRLKKSYVAMRAQIHKLNLQEKPSVVPAVDFADYRSAVSELCKTYLVD